MKRFKLYEINLFISPLIKFWYTVAIVFIMGRFLYYANKGKKEYLFTCTLIAAIISLICILVSQVELSIGFAIGIFALFGTIRYRTTPISTRFSGDADVYQNKELRFKLFNFSTYIAKGEAGIMGFNDFGRIWLDGEDSQVWHHGAGGGLWLSPFRMAVLNATWEWSKDEPSGLFSFRFRFLF